MSLNCSQDTELFELPLFRRVQALHQGVDVCICIYPEFFLELLTVNTSQILYQIKNVVLDVRVVPVSLVDYKLVVHFDNSFYLYV